MFWQTSAWETFYTSLSAVYNLKMKFDFFTVWRYVRLVVIATITCAANQRRYWAHINLLSHSTSKVQFRRKCKSLLVYPCSVPMFMFWHKSADDFRETDCTECPLSSVFLYFKAKIAVWFPVETCKYNNLMPIYKLTLWLYVEPLSFVLPLLYQTWCIMCYGPNVYEKQWLCSDEGFSINLECICKSLQISSIA